MKTINIYAVVSSKGTNVDYHEWVEKCFTNIEDAEKYALEVDGYHNYKSNIPDKVFDDVDDHWYTDMYDPQIKKFCEDNNIPTQEDISDIPEWMCHRTEEQNKMVADFADKIDEQYNDWCIKYLTEHYPEYTEEDWWDYLEAMEHSLDDWNPCKIKEYELVVNDEFEV